jgi:hypothetical protein
MKKTASTVRVDVERLPELDTCVALSASRKRQEVGGVICLGLAGGIAIYVMA